MMLKKLSCFILHFSALAVTVFVAEGNKHRALRSRPDGTRQRMEVQGRDMGIPTGDTVTDWQSIRRRAMGRGRRRGRRGGGSSDSRNDSSAGIGGSSSRMSRTIMVNVTVTNLSYRQPFSDLFVMVHNRMAPPLFKLGLPASGGLQQLAENGVTSALVDAFNNTDGVGYVARVAGAFGGGLGGAANLTFTVPISRTYHLISFASMLENTNDAFVGISSVFPHSKTRYGPAYDAGTEENNESCASIPGPACSSTPGNVASGNGEGIVHVHRGFFGIGGTLSQPEYDWRNPIMSVCFHHAYMR